MKTLEAPTRDELVAEASRLVPLLRENAQRGERDRRLPEESLQGIADSGLLKMRIPGHYGGYESDMRTVVDVLSEVARGDGSASWTLSVWAISTWMLGLFPDEVQDEVFSAPGVRVCGILSPSATVTPAPGGWTLNGQWSFNTGVLQSDWATNAAILLDGDSGPEPVIVALPVSDLQIVDDWHTAGLRATGSVTTAASEVFVPRKRVLRLVPVFEGRHESNRNAESPIFAAPFMPTACATVGAPAVGLAKGARDVFLERLPGRKITYTTYDNQAEAPLTHLQVGEAAALIAESEFHAGRSAELLDTPRAAGREWTLEERARVRLHLGATCRRAKQAVDLLNSASGGSSIYDSVPIQRIERDVQAINLHGILNPNTNFELYGRVSLGLAPNTTYL